MVFKKYIIPRFIQYITVLFIGITLVFIIPRLLPSDPVEHQLNRMTAQGQYLDPAAVEEMRETLQELYGLKGGLFQQYINYWKRLFIGNLGPSFTQFPTPVVELIKISLPWTLGLLLVSLMLSWVIGTMLGGIKVSFPNSILAKIMEVLAMGMRPIPYYIMALVLLIIFAFIFPVFPMAGGYSMGAKVGFNLRFILDLFRHAFLPIMSMVVLEIGGWFLQMRNVASNVVEEDYVVYAEASGLPKLKIIFRYIMRNAIIPQITGLALNLGFIFGGALITEIVFSYPGIGTLLYSAILAGDYNLILGINIFSIVGVSTAMLIIDLIYPLLDPRVRYQ
ncbi:MAG TPA: ABC transporter permease [Firmicutes bacterium]|jgi:peptide/nickel transport system permease protein|nr:ABC transporter permease [Bacillota bacterium]